MNTNESRGFINLPAETILDTMALMTQSVSTRNHSCPLVFIRG